MTDELPPTAPDGATSFGSVADAYDRGRPTYPRAAAAWLAGADPVTVLELGSGTGKLTTELVALGHDVHATDPDAAMLAVLQRRLPDVRASVATAERIPLPDRSVDVVVAAQCFHWFDLDEALPEIARVLKPGGRLALVWNRTDERIPWVRRLGAVLGRQDQRQGLESPLEESELFGPLEREGFRFRQTIDRRSIQDLVLSRSNIATLDPAGRSAKVAEALALYDDYGRGMDGMQLPYEASCFRAVVSPQPSASGSRGGPAAGPPAETDAGDGEQRDDPNDGTDTDMLLIDFR